MYKHGCKYIDIDIYVRMYIDRNIYVWLWLAPTIYNTLYIYIYIPYYQYQQLTAP